MPRRKMNQRLREEKSEKILEAPRTVFARKGMAATMAEVAEEAGVNQGLAYRYFPSKDVIVVTLIKQTIRSRDKLNSMVREIPGSPGERLGHIISTMVDHRSQFLHTLPVLGRFVKPHLNGEPVRDEDWQARKIVEPLGILDDAGVHGAFVSQFLSQNSPYDSNPRYDLDMASFSLVKSYSGGTHGAIYPDMPWEPKESFKAVAEYYLTH